MTIVTTSIAVIAMVIPWIPKVNKALKFETPEPEFYAFVAAICVMYTGLVQVGKTIYVRTFKEWL